MSIPIFVAEDLMRLEIALKPDTLEQLGRYLDILLDQNTRQNLTSVRDRDTAWRRHIVDSLTLLVWLEGHDKPGTVIDVGSGGGLPGVVLAVACPEWQVTLLESSTKKAAFLKRCVQELNLSNVRVVCERAETIGHDRRHRQTYDAVVCRAIGPLPESLEYTLPLLRTQGVLFAIKGPSVLAELDGAGDALLKLGGGDVEVFDAYPEHFDHGSKIVVVHKIHPTPNDYPRSPGTPKKSPL